jgi:hypothetical protein
MDNFIKLIYALTTISKWFFSWLIVREIAGQETIINAVLKFDQFEFIYKLGWYLLFIGIIISPYVYMKLQHKYETVKLEFDKYKLKYNKKTLKP